MSGIGNLDNTTPNIFTGAGDVPEGETPPESEATPALIDLLLEGELQDPEFLQLRVTRAINLPPGSVSLLELAKIISTVINQLKEALNEAELLDGDLTRKFHLNTLSEAQDLIDGYNDLEAQLDAMKEAMSDGGELESYYTALLDAKANFDNQIAQTAGADSAAVQEVNQYIAIYNDPVAFENFADNSFGGNQANALAFINGKINSYNSYMASRPNLQAALNDYRDSVIAYNNEVDEANAQLVAVNSDRADLGLPLLPTLDKTPVPNGNIQTYLPANNQLPNSLPTLALPADSTNINLISTANLGSYGSTPAVQPPGVFPTISYSEAFALLWLPNALSSLSFMSSMNRALDLAESLRNTEALLFNQLGFNIIMPNAYIQRAQDVFLDSIGGLGGGGLGLAAFAMGLHSRNLEIALSRGILGSIAANSRMPITGRVFARLQFTALELLQKSSLLSPLPALRYIASAIGYLGSASPAVRVAISLAITMQVMGAVGGGLMRSLVNAQFNRMPHFARVRTRMAMRGVVRAEAGLRRAVASGNPGRVRRSLARVGRSRRRLARATRLNATFGLLSIGGLASFTRAVAATMSLSVMSVAMAHFGRAIGLPGIVAQIFAHVSGVPTLDLLVAMSGGSRILDILDNPFSILALKQTLVDTLVFGRGFSSVSASLMINGAVNSIILRGGINNFSHMRYELVNEFQRAGFSFFQAHQLANETVAMIRGDIGINFLNAAFGLNFDRSIIAASIVNNIIGADVGLAGAMLSNAVVRSLMFGGFGSTVRLQNELTAQFQNLGLSWSDAYGMASNMVNFIETVGVVIPLTRFPGLSNVLLGNTLLSAVAFGSTIVRNELISDFQARGLSYFQAEFLASQVTSLAARTFATPGNLFELALEAAIERTGSSFETQREFRDNIYNELTGVGFSRNDAMFLANSVASYGLDGSNISIFGVSAARLAAIEEITVNRLSNELGVSGGVAHAILNEARDRAISQGPYSSQDQFQNVLKEELFRAVVNHTGRYDGHMIFDRAIAELSDPGTILTLAALTEQIGSSVLGILRPDLGARIAEEIKNQILVALLGGTTVDEIADLEQRNPLSVLNMFEDGLSALLKSDEEEDIQVTLRKLIQLLQAMLTPNAELGFLLQSLSDSPSTFIGSVLGSDQPKGEFLQIPA